MICILQGRPLASGEVTVTDTATLLTTLASAAGIPVTGHAIWMQVQGNPLRVAFGGSSPTADVGFTIQAGQSLFLASAGYIQTMRVINDTALSNATIYLVVEQ